MDMVCNDEDRQGFCHMSLSVQGRKLVLVVDDGFELFSILLAPPFKCSDYVGVLPCQALEL